MVRSRGPPSFNRPQERGLPCRKGEITVFHICGPRELVVVIRQTCEIGWGTGHRILGQRSGPEAVSRSLELQEGPRSSLCLHVPFAGSPVRLAVCLGLRGCGFVPNSKMCSKDPVSPFLVSALWCRGLSCNRWLWVGQC